MSKTLGTTIDPLEAASRFGPDPLRLYLVKEIAFGGDGDFSWSRYDERYNVDLANNLGNLVSRVTAMAERYRQGRLAPTGAGIGPAGPRGRGGGREVSRGDGSSTPCTKARRPRTRSSTRPTSTSPRPRRGRSPRIRPPAIV